MPADWEPKIFDMDWLEFQEVLKDSKKFNKFLEAIEFKEFEGEPKDIKCEDSLFYPYGPTDIPIDRKSVV